MQPAHDDDEKPHLCERWVESENERNSCWNGAAREEGGTTTYQLLWHEELGRHFHFISLSAQPPIHHDDDDDDGW